MKIRKIGKGKYEVIIESKPKPLTEYNRDVLEFNFPFSKEKIYIIIIKGKKIKIFTSESNDKERAIVYYKLSKDIIELIKQADLVVIVHNHPFGHNEFSILDAISFGLLSIYNKNVVNFLVVFPQSFSESQTECVYMIHGCYKIFYDFLPIEIENGKLYVDVSDILRIIVNNLKNIRTLKTLYSLRK